MKNIISLMVIFLFSVCAYAHPGKTDHRGGHKCWKNCSEWELGYGEYHLHDKDWNPIRLERHGDPLTPLQSEPIPQPEPVGSIQSPEQTHTVAATTDVKRPESKAINEYRYNTTVYEENILPFNAILLLILSLLLVIVLIFIRKKRDKG